MLSLNSSPYFDDFDESKDFHKILYKPGIPVQARELTQVQSILQTQISRFGDHVFANGARVSGGQGSTNNQTFSVQLTDASSNISALTAGTYMKGAFSGLLAELVQITPATIASKSTIVYVVISKGTNGAKFSNSEAISFYSDYELTTQVISPLDVAGGTINQAIINGITGYNTLSVTDVTKVEIGAYIASLDAYVISIDATASTFKINKELVADVNSLVDVSIDSVTPTILFGVTEGIFYINGYFARVGQQSIIPSPRNRWCSYTIGLSQVQEIIDSDEDSTLLDPAQGSYNYAAPGADRLKISLNLVAYEKDNITDPNFIELMRVEEGNVVRQSKYTEYSELMSTIARRTYDESGNYVVNPFIINLKDEGSVSTVTAVINPGKAYVGGYEFETISPTKLLVDRALETESTTNFMVDTFIGNYVYVTTVSGTIPDNGLSVTIKNGATSVGTANFAHLAPDATGVKLYLSSISGSIASGMTITSAAGFTATIASAVQDTDYKLSIFPFPQSFVKSVTDVAYKTKRIFRSVVFTNGVATISGSNTNERFSGGTGTLSAVTAKTYYAIFNTGGNTAFTVTKPAVSANSVDQCQINLGVSYNGTGDIVATIDVNQESARVKTKITKLLNVASINTSTFTSLGYADLYAIQYAAVIPTIGIIKGVWTATAYVANDLVYHNNVVYQATSATISSEIPGTTAKWSRLTDITSDLLIDAGQRDGWYDHALIKAKTTARTNLIVLFDYFTHSGNGLITVNSYPVSYTDIPSYVTSMGMYVELKDSIDARPRRKDGAATLTFDSYQIPDEFGIELSLEYYLARIDKLVLTNARTFKVIKGVSSYTQPLPPADLQDAMTLAMLMIPPFTNDVTTVQVRTINNRRYTMRDIGVIDQRLGNVEYYTSINMLESSVLNSTQYAPNGTELFKAGFLADNFSSFSVGNTISPEYKCSIDNTVGICRPQFKMGTLELVEDTMLSTTQTTGDLVTLPYTPKSFIKNVFPTSYMNINPFNVLRNIGTASLSPSSDYWFGDNVLPQINVLDENTSAFAAAQKAATATNQQTQWGSWTTFWTGNQTSSSTSASRRWMNGAKGAAHGTYVTTDTTTTTNTDRIESRSKSVQSVSSSTIISSDNTKLVSREIQPFIRERDINITIDGMTPYTQIYAWIDDVLVEEYVLPSFSLTQNTVLSTKVTNGGSGYSNATVTVVGSGTGASITAIITSGVITGLNVVSPGSGYTTNPTIVITGTGTGATATASITVPSIGAPLISNEFGHVEAILRFPAAQFPCGSHKLAFTDTRFNNRSETCEASAIYTAEGYINNLQRTVLSTRIPIIVTGSISEQRSDSFTTTAATSNTVKISPSDPLAQTFFIETDSTPNGVFVHSIDIFFATTDQSMPVIMELRATDNGYPSNTILPFSTVVKYPSEIITSTDGKTATTFTFKSPVYLTPGEYAIVVKSGSNKYHTFIAEMSKPIIGTTKVISDQPYIGSLFESQNASTWSADQFKDLCFEMRICEFTKSEKTLVLKNSEIGMKADVVHALIQNLQPADTSITTIANLPSYAGNIVIDTDVNLPSQSSFDAVGDASISIILKTNDVNISPVIDLERTALICIENIINKTSDITTPETDYQLGNALAKYVTGRVTLNQGFNANNLVVYVNVNRPQQSSIEVYYRAKNEFDTTDLSGHAWAKMTHEVNGGNTSQEGQFVEDKWSMYDYVYGSFQDFNTYEIKVVMYSTNTSFVPVLADVRAIALA